MIDPYFYFKFIMTMRQLFVTGYNIRCTDKASVYISYAVAAVCIPYTVAAVSSLHAHVPTAWSTVPL